MMRLGLVMAVAMTACARCGKEVAPPRGAGIEHVLPRGAMAVVVVPSLRSTGAKLVLLEQLKVASFVAPLQGFASPKAFADAVMTQLGVDLRSEKEIEKAGLDAARALGAALLLTGDVYLVLPVKDASALHSRLEGLAVNRLGSGAGGEQKSGVLTIKTFSPKQGERPRLGYVVRDGWAFVATDDGISRLAQAASLSESDRLSSEAPWREAFTGVASHDVYAWLPPGSLGLSNVPLAHALVTASLTATGFEVNLKALWKGPSELLVALAPQSAPDWSALLPADAFLTARYTGSARGLFGVAKELVGPFVARAFDEGGFDLNTEVLEQLSPGAVLSLSLADRPPMDRGVPAFDIRQTNPFAYAHLAGVAPVADAARVMPTLKKVAEVAPKFGAKLEKQQREGRDLYFTTWSQGQGVHFAPKGSLVAFASPVQRLDALLASTATPGVATVSKAAVELKVDLTALAKSVRALPESAWGLGGFALKPTTVRWLDATDDLKSVSLTVSAKDQTVLATLRLSLALAGAKAP